MDVGVGKPERELSVGEIVSITFTIYFSRFTDFVVPFVLAGLVGGVLSAVTFSSLPFDMLSSRTPSAEDIRLLLSNLGSIVAALFFLGAVSWVIFTIVEGVVVKFASDVIEKGAVNHMEALNIVAARLPSLLGASLITGILTAVGFLLVAPGVIFLIIFTLVLPSVVIERLDAFKSLGRSTTLVSRRWRKTLTLLLIIVTTILAVNLTIGFIITSFTPPPLGTILTSVVFSVLQPLYVISITVLYYSMITREQPTVEAA